MALVLAAGNADHVAAFDPGDLADDRADRARGRRNHDGLAGLRLADLEQAEIGGEACNAIDAEEMRQRLHLRHLGEVLCRYSRIILPAGVAKHDVTGCQARRPGCDDFGDRAACHNRVGFDSRAIRRAMHPGAVGGIERDEARAQQSFAVIRFRDRRAGQLEMFRSELSAWLFDQQDLAIDSRVHGVPPVTCDDYCSSCRAENHSTWLAQRAWCSPVMWLASEDRDSLLAQAACNDLPARPLTRSWFPHASDRWPTPGRGWLRAISRRRALSRDV